MCGSHAEERSNIVTKFWIDEPDIAQGLEEVAELIKQQAAGASPYIASYLENMITARGKMLRPALVIIGSRLGDFRENWVSVLDRAAQIEMIHVASLIHDDLIDSSSTRRGRPTLYKELGARRAVVAGDYVLSRAMAIQAREKQGTQPAAAVSQAFCRLCDGEIVQDSEEWNFFISKSHYLRRIAGKTAALFALSGYLGANSAQADKRHQYMMHEIGYNIGMAFQIRDDVLDMTGTPESLGKPAGRDLRSGVCTLPLIYALNSDDSGWLSQTLKGRKSLSKRRTAKIIAEIDRLGGIAHAEADAETYSSRAVNLIKSLPDSNSSDILLRMMDRLYKRNH
jgi:heptaprenyl diphosphate synthase